MKRHLRRPAILALAVITVLLPQGALALKGPVAYRVSIEDPDARRLRVAITLDPAGDSSVRFVMPVWAPGYYQILDFQKDVSRFRARDASGAELAVTRPNDFTWQVAAAQTPLNVEYEVEAKDAGFGFFRNCVKGKTGYMSGPAALMYVDGGKELPATLQFDLPENWKIACSLDPDGENRFKAANYDELIDSPAQLGEFERLEFTVRGVPFAAILVGESDVNRQALVKLLTQISQAGIDFFGSAPFKRYYYLIHFDPGNFGGGLEHRSSTVLNVFGKVGGSPAPWGALIAHEFFHAWNVKAIRPAVLGPFDYTRKVRTTSLWFAEGVTEYYAHVLLRLAGIHTPEQFLQQMSAYITELQGNPARLKVSAEEASLKAWEGGSFGYGGLNYYTKGCLLGLLFDVKIRSVTGGKRGLDDVLRLMYERYAAHNAGYDDGAILRAMNEVAGTDLSEAYRKYVAGTEEIPWTGVLKMAGLTFRGDSTRPYLGVGVRPGRGSVPVVDFLLPFSPADRAGVSPGDRILALNGARVRMATWSRSVSRLSVGQAARLKIQRQGRTMHLVVRASTRPDAFRQIVPISAAGETARQVRAALLREAAVGVDHVVAGG